MVSGEWTTLTHITHWPVARSPAVTSRRARYVVGVVVASVSHEAAENALGSSPGRAHATVTVSPVGSAAAPLIVAVTGALTYSVDSREISSVTVVLLSSRPSAVDRRTMSGAACRP